MGDVGLLGAPDRAIWTHAAAHGFLLVTKDEDFHRLSVLRGPPPEVIWIRLGNASTREVACIRRARYAVVVRFSEHEDAVLLALA